MVCLLHGKVLLSDCKGFDAFLGFINFLLTSALRVGCVCYLRFSPTLRAFICFWVFLVSTRRWLWFLFVFSGFFVGFGGGVVVGGWFFLVLCCFRHADGLACFQWFIVFFVLGGCVLCLVRVSLSLAAQHGGSLPECLVEDGLLVW